MDMHVNMIDPADLDHNEINIVLGVCTQADGVYGLAADSLTKQITEGFTGVLRVNPNADRVETLGALVTPVRFALSVDAHAPETERPSRASALRTLLNQAVHSMERGACKEAIPV